MSVITALYRGQGTLANAIIRRWQRSPYSHAEMVTRVTPGDPGIGGNIYECWSASATDGGVRPKVMRLKPENWELYQLQGPRSTDVREWFLEHEGAGYDWFGLLGFHWRPFRGSSSNFFCSEACAASIGIKEPWRFDVATWAEMAKRYGKRIDL